MEAKITVLATHRAAIGAKRGTINRELAFHFARQVTDYAAAAGATVIAVEDLATLEPRGHGRVNNNRAAQSARRRAVDALEHTAAGAGIEVVAVPARGSSALCPGCNAPVTRPGGYHSAWCGHCSLGGNRDHVAGVNLAKRVLVAKTTVVRRRGHTPRVNDTAHAPVRRCRDKTGPTPPRPRHRRVRHSSLPVLPRAGVNPNNHVPAPGASVWDTAEPVALQSDTGSRAERVSAQNAAVVAGSNRFT